MFTGLVVHRGSVESIEISGQIRRVYFRFLGKAPMISLGESIAVNGVCLTVAEKIRKGFRADLLLETMKATTLGSLKPGLRVHLEKALRFGDKMGGHFVSGHVDATVELEHVDLQPSQTVFLLKAPERLFRWIVLKGSICLEGVSLTVQEVRKPFFKVALVPHTLKKTLLGSKKQGELLNLEVDLLARYGSQAVCATESLKNRRDRVRTLRVQGF